MAKRKENKIVRIVTWLLLLLLLVGGIGAVLHFVGIGKDDITDIINPTFRVEYDGNVYKTDTENVLAIPEGGQARFEVKNGGDCSVKIVPNVTAETDFSYIVDGQTYMYSEENDLSVVFDLQVYKGAFTVNFDNATSIESVLSKIWGTDKIIINDIKSFSFYKIVVTSLSGEVIEILCYVPITGITLSPESIVF